MFKEKNGILSFSKSQKQSSSKGTAAFARKCRLVQTLACLSALGLNACGNVQASNDEPLAPRGGQATQLGVSSQPEAAGVNPQPEESVNPRAGLYIPVRLTRAFFENPLAGQIRILGSNGEEKALIESSVSWAELPPTAPAPTGNVLADFRDRQGCASFDSRSGLQLCFNIQPDVSSVDLDGKGLRVQGQREILDRKCDAGNSLEFIKAERTADRMKVQFKVKGTTEAGCASAEDGLTGQIVEFSLHTI